MANTSLNSVRIDFTIREITLNDVQAIHNFPTDNDCAEFVLETYIKRGKGFVAEFDKSIIGYVVVMPNKDEFLDSYFLDDLFVLPNHRCIGIGSALVLKVIEEFGCKTIYCFVHSNLLTWYEKFDFRMHTEILPNLFEIGDNGCVLIRKRDADETQ
jgi:predicted N-acetyltransferase YhbS